jgi:hypothetical protein
MTDDRDSTERFTDAEIAFLRYARFGELPPRILPAEHVELVETEPRRHIPDGAVDPDDDVRGIAY